MTTAKQKVAQKMKDYDIEAGDADTIAEEIANSPSMNAVLTKNQRRLLVLGLFDGDTGEDEEDAAMKILKKASLSDLKWIIGKIGWTALTDELDTLDIAWLRGKSGSLKGFDYTDDDADDIAEYISKHKSWLPGFDTNEKVTLVKALFDGNTIESEEDAAMVLLESMSDSALRTAVKKLTWDELQSELDEEDIIVLIKRTLDLAYFDPPGSDFPLPLPFIYTNVDDIALVLSKDANFLKKLTRAKRAKLVRALFVGDTGESEEDAATRILLSEPGGEGLIKLCHDVGGWPELLDELDGDALNEITGQITDHLDIESSVLHADMPWLYDSKLAMFDGNSGPSVEATVKALSVAKQKALLNKAVAARLSILKQFATRFRRKKPLPTTRLVNTLKWMIASTGHQVAKATQLHLQITCTALVAANLEEADYAQLVRILPDMVDPHLTAAQRLATFETFDRLEPEFLANEELVRLLGDANQRSLLLRFNNVKDAFLTNFDPDLPPATVLDDVAAALSGLGEELVAGIDALRDMIADISRDLLAHLNLGALTGSNDDDEARQLISKLASQKLNGISILARLPTWGKLQLANTCIDGPTEDEDEEAILSLIRETKKVSRAEMFQLLTGLSMTTLDSNIQGDQWDTFLALVN